MQADQNTYKSKPYCVPLFYLNPLAAVGEYHSHKYSSEQHAVPHQHRSIERDGPAQYPGKAP